MTTEAPARITQAERDYVGAFAQGTVPEGPEAMRSVQETVRKLLANDVWLWAELNKAHKRNGELDASLRAWRKPEESS
jgi:hypothetical protein